MPVRLQIVINECCVSDVYVSKERLPNKKSGAGKWSKKFWWVDLVGRGVCHQSLIQLCLGCFMKGNSWIKILEKHIV